MVGEKIMYPESITLASEDRRMPGLIKGENLFKREMSGGLA
jgi:hypothetical protein